MRNDLSALATRMAASDISIASRVTTEPHLPRWSQATSGTAPQNPLGHDALYISDRLLRARSGSIGSGQMSGDILAHATLQSAAKGWFAADGVTNPPGACRLFVQGHPAGATLTGSVIISGTNPSGGSIAEYVNLNGSAIIQTNLTFATVTCITTPRYTTSGDWVSVTYSYYETDLADSGVLYFACITDLSDPSAWEGEWAAVPGASVVPPAYGYALKPGQMALAADGNGLVRIFYFSSYSAGYYKLYVAESSNWGGTWSVSAISPQVVVPDYSAQVVAVSPTEVYYTQVVTAFDRSFQGKPSTLSSVMGRLTHNGSAWVLDENWPMKGRVYFHRSERDTTVWGQPTWAGLGAAIRPDGRRLLATGALFQDILAWGASQQGLHTFVYDKNANLWWEGQTVRGADYSDDAWYFQTFARASVVNGRLVVIFQSEEESTDLRQTDIYQVVPRRYEIAYAWSLDGDRFTEPQVITTDARNVGAGPIIFANDTLYMVSWLHVMVADATHVFGVSNPTEQPVTGWNVSQTGREPNMQLALSAPGTFSGQPGDLVRIYAGDKDGTVQVAQGYIDSVEPDLTAGSHAVQVNALTMKPLADIVARDNLDWVPQATTLISPNDMGQVMVDKGQWTVTKPSWLSRNVLCIQSWDDTIGYDWHQVALFTHPKVLNGAAEATVRLGLHQYGPGVNYGTPGNPDTWFPAPGGPSSSCRVLVQNGVTTQWAAQNYGSWITDTINQEAVGFVARADAGNRCYIFAWEPGLHQWTHDHNYGGSAKIDSYAPGLSAATTINNALCLYLFEYDDSAKVRYITLLQMVSMPITPGDIACMRMELYHGTIRCLYKTQAATTWTTAFTYTAGAAFGAGRFGAYGRGMNGVEGPTGLKQEVRNRGWMWDIQVASDESAIIVEDVVKDFAWKAGVEIETRDLLNDASRTPGAAYLYPDLGMTNPVIEANVSFPAGVESGFVVRATNDGNGAYLGITPGASTALRFYTKAGGATTYQRTIPCLCSIAAGVPVPIRVVAVDAWYSVFVGKRLLGSFYLTYSNGIQVGIFGTATFTNVRVPELYEVPPFATLDAGQAIGDAISGFLAKRRIRRFATWDGTIRFSYFQTRDRAGANVNRMLRNTVYKSDRAISHCRVNGAAGWAEYKSPSLLQDGRRFKVVDMPDILSREGMYIEARTIVRESGEMLEQNNFMGYPDLTLEPEDVVPITVTAQGISGDYIVDDLSLVLSNEDGKLKLVQQVGTRQFYVE
jgi:hypothetical protein